MSALHLYRRDLRSLRRLAREVVEQVDHFERNTAAGADDTIRTLPIEQYVRRMSAAAGRAARRWIKAHQETT